MPLGLASNEGLGRIHGCSAPLPTANRHQEIKISNGGRSLGSGPEYGHEIEYGNKKDKIEEELDAGSYLHSAEKSGASREFGVFQIALPQ